MKENNINDMGLSEKKICSDLLESQTKKWKSNIESILEQDIIDLTTYTDRKIWRSLTENARPGTLWGKKDWIQYRLKDWYESKAIPTEYAPAIMDFHKYDKIYKFISNETYTCEKVDSIENNLTIEQILAIWWEYLSYIEMSSEKIIVIGYMLWVEEIEKIWQ